MLLAVIAFTCIPTAVSQGPTTLQLVNPRFVNEADAVTELSPPVSIQAGVPGDFVASLEFTSPLYNVEKNEYELRGLRCLWSLEENGSPVSTEPEGVWYGTSITADVIVQDFSQETGIGHADIIIPLGRVREPSVRAPGLRAGTNDIVVVLGWDDELAEDENGVPTHVIWNGEASISAYWPDVRVEVLDPVVTNGTQIMCLLVLKEPASAQRSFHIESTVDKIVEFPETDVTIEEGIDAVEFYVQSNEIGRYRVRAIEDGHAPVLSRRCVIVSTSRMFMMQSEGGGFAGNPVEDPLGDPPPWANNWKKCSKASCVPTGVGVRNTCGECTTGTPQCNCPDYASFFTPLSCPFAILSSCDSAGVQPMSCGAFQRSSTQFVECGDVHGEAEVSVKVKKVGGSVSVGGSIKYRKMCCTYTEVGQSTLNVNQCNTF